MTEKAYPPNAILTVKDVCEWLEIGESTFWELPIKHFNLLRGRKKNRLVRVFARDVYEYLEELVP